MDSSSGDRQTQRLSNNNSGSSTTNQQQRQTQQQQGQGQLQGRHTPQAQCFDQLQHRRLLDQSLTRSHSAPDAWLGSVAHSSSSFSRSGSLVPFSHYQQQQQLGYQHQHHHSSLQQQQSFTPPPSSSESLVALLREQRSPEVEPDKGLFGGSVAPRTNHEDGNGFSGSESSASPMLSSQGFVMEDAVSSQTSSPARPPVKTRQQITRAAKAAVASTKGAKTNAATANGIIGDGVNGTTEKRSRYLREMDRRSIIHRIDRGEKQAALAKEFGVTRAAICHINKNRVEILTRSTRADVHSGARHPKRGLYTMSASTATSTAGLPAAVPVPPSVFEVRSQAMTLALTRLRRRETESREFQICTERAFRILLEEALARVLTRSIEVVTPSDFVCEGVSVVKPSCGVSISEDGFALLQVYRNIQPTSPSGFITLNATAIHEGVSSEPTLQKVCVPPDLRAYDVFLFEATCATGTGACVAIQALLDFGASEAAIHLVCLLASALAVSEICSRFPQVHLVTGAVDPEVSDDGGDTICPGLGNFTERYFNATVVHHTSLGANADL